MTDPETEQRKASDIILSLETQISNLVKMVANSDFTLKLILNRLDILNSKIENQGKDDDSSEEEEEDDEDNVIFAEHKIEVDNNPIGVRRTARPESYKTAPGTVGKKVPVHQMVLDPNGKIVYLADVEVVTKDKNLVIKTRTTAAGKWQGSLVPGVYTLSILKRETDNRKRLEFNKEITIIDSEVPLSLDPARLV